MRLYTHYGNDTKALRQGPRCLFNIYINQIPLEFMKTRFFQLFAFVMLAGLLMQGCQKEPQSVDSV